MTEREREKARAREREKEGGGGCVVSRVKCDKVSSSQINVNEVRCSGSQINVNEVLGSKDETRDDDSAALSDMHAYFDLVCASMVIQRYLKQWKARQKARDLAAAAAGASGVATSRISVTTPVATSGCDCATRKNARELTVVVDAPGGADSRTPVASPAGTRAHSPATAVAISPVVSLACAPSAGTTVDHMPPLQAPCAHALPEVAGM